MPNIVVVGSINMDLAIRVDRHPRPGETVPGSSLVRAPGGKGANQAVAAARSDAKVAFLGAVGDDDAGQELLRVLETEGIDTRLVRVQRKETTGVALITIDARGENTIVVSPGANGSITAARVRAASPSIQRTGLVVVQLEIPSPAVEAAIAIAARHGVPVILNPAPAGVVTDRVLRKVSVLIANETEAEVLLGREIDGLSASRAAARDLAARLDGGTAVLTLGARGAWLFLPGSKEAILVPPHKVRAVDTTAAGDTFVGAFAARYLGCRDAREASRFAAAAAALAVTRLGAIPSIPRRAEVEKILGGKSRQTRAATRQVSRTGPRAEKRGLSHSAVS